jgi:EAL domain-containing protein (putative c-di-GMP-specific phosphodiesterase class I)
MGFRTAIDDFNAGYSSFSLPSKFQPDIVKTDMELIRNIDADRVKRLTLGSKLHMLRDMGIELMQGFFLLRPSSRRWLAYLSFSTCGERR